MEFRMTGIVMILIFILGSCIFSFLNVVIYRLPRKMDFITGRSMCLSCGHVLGAFDMIPVLGWVILRGKCRYCGRKVSMRYPAVELLGGVLGVCCLHHYGMNQGAIVSFAFLCVLTVVSFVDLDTMEIPFSFVLAAGVVGILSCLFFPEISIFERGIGMVCVSLPLYLLTIPVPGAFGGGDIRLTAACGIFLGWKLNLLALFLAVMGGGIYGMWLLATKRKGKKDHFAFGPFLCVGMATAMFAGENILNWYLGFFT